MSINYNYFKVLVQPTIGDLKMINNITIGKSMKYGMGALAAAGLMAIGISSCKQKEPTALEKAYTELQSAQSQYSADSLHYAINSKDSTAAKEKLAELQNLRTVYLLGHPKTGNPDEVAFENHLNKELKNDKNLEKLNAGIALAQMKVDDLTGKTLAKSAERLNIAKDNYRLEQLMKKEDSTLTSKEKAEKQNLMANDFYNKIQQVNESNAKIVANLNKLITDWQREDSVMKSFDKNLKSGIDTTDVFGRLQSTLVDTQLDLARTSNIIKAKEE